MVVWQGITEGGTAVPVQITEEGKVVAIGQAGPEGPQGPEGPPGQAEWPPNPIEGAFLVWLNGEPTWYTEQPIPTPPGTAGPIIQVDQNSILLFGSDIDQNIFFNGVQVYAVNADGSNWNGGKYNTSEVWTNAVVGTDYGNTYKIAHMFDGNELTLTCPYPGTSIIFTPSTPIPINSSLRIKGSAASSNEYWKINGQIVTNVPSGEVGTDYGYWFTPNTGSPITELQTLEFYCTSGVRPAFCYAIEVDGKILLDPLAGPYPTGQISTVANNSALLSRVQGVWTEGLYMKADESAQAAWLFSKRRNGKILGDKE